MRVIYIAGKYRHYDENGQPDLPRMMAEVEQERLWSRLVWRAGHMPIAPLCNSVHMEGDEHLPPDAYIEGDLALLHRLAIGHDCILMRPGWESSVGANAEHDTAVERGLVVIHGAQGMDRVREYLEGL